MNRQATQASPVDVVPEDRIILAKTAEIRTSPFQPRRHFDEAQIDELAASIRESGLVQPLIVRRVDGKFELIAGERRLRAVISLGMTEVKVVVHEATDQEVAELTLIENLQREDLTPLEEAEQYRLLQVRFNMKQDTIARHVGKSRTVVANMVRLLDLSPEARRLLEENSITVGHAKVLLQLRDTKEQEQAARKVVSGNLTVRQTEKLVRGILMPAPRAPQPASPAPMPEAYRSICERLSSDFGTRVNIAPKGKSHGVIEIPYSGQEDLKRILEIFGVTAQL